MTNTPYGHKVYAMAAEYPSAAALYEAAKRVRDAGFRRWDVFSPFPIHGMDEAMGLGKSWLSGWVLFGGISGLLTAALLQFGPSSILYPLDVHGKPTGFFTIPAFFPIMFELTVFSLRSRHSLRGKLWIVCRAGIIRCLTGNVLAA